MNRNLKSIEDIFNYLTNEIIINENFVESKVPNNDINDINDKIVCNANLSKLLVDLETNEDGYKITAELAGLTEDKIDITIENGNLSIIGDYGENKLRQGKHSWTRKLAYIDPESITANYENGLLIVDIKKLESTKPKKINISNKTNK